jgi:hypothetical protein
MDLRSLFSDVLAFLEGRLREAREDQKSQLGAMSEAAGYVRCFRGQIEGEEGNFLLTQVMLVWEPASVVGWWLEQGKLDRERFMEESANALDKIGDLRKVLFGT